MQNILVAGGAGFIGSNLIAKLLEQGHKVICVDNYLTGYKHNLEALPQQANLQLIEHDITQPLELEDQEIDQIYNLACAASPPKYQANPIHTAKTSFQGTLNLLELAQKKTARLLQASTSEIYGDPQIHPQTESYWGNVNSMGLRSCYDEGKRIGETLCADFARLHGMDVRIARIFNTYGPKMDAQDGRVVSNFLNQAMLGKPLTIYGTGEQTRSFCFVDDMLSGLIGLMNADVSECLAVNLGNPHEFSLLELIEKIEKLLGKKLHKDFHPLPQDDPKQRQPDISRAKQLFGWEPKVQLEEGLAMTLEYFSLLRKQALQA